MRRSVIDGTCFSFMLGVGEHYLPAFVLVLALGEVASGLIVTIPPAVGAALAATPTGVGDVAMLRFSAFNQRTTPEFQRQRAELL